MDTRALRAHYFPKLSEGETPELSQLRALIVKLDSAGRREEAKHLISWYEALKADKNAEADNHAARKKLLGNIAYAVLIVIIVVTGILASLYFLNKPQGSTGDEIIVCSVNGVIHEGSACDIERLPGAESPSEN